MQPSLPSTESEPGSDLAKLALDCYFESLRAIAECVAEVCPPLGMPYRLRLMRELRRLSVRTRPETLEASLKGLIADLSEFAARFREQQTEGDQAASRVLGGLSDSIRREVDASSREAHLLLEVAEQLKISAELDSADDLRRFAAQQAVGLEALGRRMEQGAQFWPRKMNEFVEQVEGWLLTGDNVPAIDPLTGLYTRHEIERRIREGKSFTPPYTFLRFDFATEAVHGGRISAGARELLLARLGEMLSEQVRPRDCVARWDSSCFLVVMQAEPRIAAERGPDIARWLSDRYALREGDTDEEIAVKVAAHVVDPWPEESADTLLERIQAAGLSPESH